MLEPIVWIYRFNERGEEFDGCCTILKAYDNTAFIKGLNGIIREGDLYEMRGAMLKEGIEEVTYKRKGVWKTVDLRRKARGAVG